MRPTIHVVVTPKDHQRLRELADHRQLTVSDLIRDYISDILYVLGKDRLEPVPTPGRPGKVKLSRYDKVKIRELYQAGLSTEKIAEQFGCTSGATYWICRDLIRDSPQRQGRLRKKAQEAVR